MPRSGWLLLAAARDVCVRARRSPRGGSKANLCYAQEFSPRLEVLRVAQVRFERYSTRSTVTVPLRNTKVTASVENACLNTTNICRFRQQKLLKITLL